MLHVENLNIRLNEFSLHSISFTVDRGAYFVLLGASGVGKTVLLEGIAGLIKPVSGSIILDGCDVSHARIRDRRMGLVYQDQALFPHLNVWRNIAYGAKIRESSEKSFVESLAAEVGVMNLLHRYPGTLSGGEAQRVALARALATRPKCLLLDEPLSSLDIQSRTAMRGLLRKLHKNGLTVVHVTHDYEEALSLATHVGILEGGTLAQAGVPEEVFRHPKSEFVARFVGVRNVFSGILKQDVSGDDCSQFVCRNLVFHVLTNAPAGAGKMMVRSEDITLSTVRPDSSAQNCFAGTIVDVVPAPVGMEVYVDIGVEVAALITGASARKLMLKPGSSIWVGFKASAARFLED